MWLFGLQRDILETEFEPVHIGKGRAGEGDEDDQEDHPAPTTGTRQATAEAEIILKPVEQPAQQRQPQQAAQASGSIIHVVLLLERSIVAGLGLGYVESKPFRLI